MLTNILATITNKDILLFIVVISLILISMLMVYLVYSQNRQLTNKLIDQDKTKENIEELKNISKTLENIPRNRNIDLTDYETEQEEKAIISYEELLNTKNNASINYLNSISEDNIEVKQIDLDNTGKIELDPLKKELNTKVTLISYEHEEEFLKSLKQLQYLLNK